ncbi:MAG: SurA N-terminal domain-containing protein [Cycloclasticus sp.]
MLDRLRVHVKGWLGIVILVMISIPFALFGLQNYTNGGSEAALAEVGGYKIYQSDVNLAYQQRVAELKGQYGERYSADLFNEDSLRGEVLNRLVQEKLVMYTIEKDGYSVSDQAILDVISSLNAFKKDGRFDKNTYEQLLRDRGLTTQDFVQKIKVGLQRDQFINAIIDTTLVDDSEINDFYRLNNQTRDIRYATLSIAAFLDGIEVTKEELDMDYARNEHLYKTPEQASIDYIELSLADLQSTIELTEAELLSFYEAEQQTFITKGRRRASHILLEAPDGTAEAEAEAKRAQAEKILARIKNGEDFAELAKEFSDDLGSSKQGGDLGLLGEGMMGGVFEDTLLLLNEGDVSEVIHTNYGFQIIKLTEKKDDQIKPFDSVKAEVEALYKNKVSSEKFFQLAERLAELSFENPDTLSPIVEELGLTIKQQAFFNELAGEGIAESDKVRHMTFSEDVRAGNNSEVIELAAEHLVVLRINEYQEESLKSFEQVRSSLENSVKMDKAGRLIADKADEFLAQVKLAQSISELANNEGVTMTDLGPVARNSDTAPARLLRDAFSMSHPKNGELAYKVSTLDNGDVAIIELSLITDGDTADISDESRGSFKRFLTQLTGEVTLAASLANLSVDAEVNFANTAE